MQTFGLIHADPPWPFATRGNGDQVPARGEQPYPTMTMDELRALPVEQHAAKDCVLIMWIVEANLEDALALGKAWGFTYKTSAFTWRKMVKVGSKNTLKPLPAPEDRKARTGMGYWTRKQTERCILFTRGRPKRLDAGVVEIIDAEIREHSRKPDETYERCERLAAGPYLDLFGRCSRKGWKVWGNEPTKFDSVDPGSISEPPEPPVEGPRGVKRAWATGRLADLADVLADSFPEHPPETPKKRRSKSEILA